MNHFQTISAVRQCVETWKNNAERVAFVPTMGNLHEGHLTLVREAKRVADRVMVSIFVNPTQFGANEDFASYPRTESADCIKLASVGCDAVFLPSVETVYATRAKTHIHVADITESFCGASRKGHFSGVATVVCKLLNIVNPHVALFGLKDFQQFVVIQTVVSDLNLPVEIIGIPTVRDEDGLAMSSRNAYLSEQERAIAPQLYKTLECARSQLESGLADFSSIQARASATLTQYGFVVEYFNVARRADLVLATPEEKERIILAAAKLGKTRLIDNIWLN